MSEAGEEQSDISLPLPNDIRSSRFTRFTYLAKRAKEFIGKRSISNDTNQNNRNNSTTDTEVISPQVKTIDVHPVIQQPTTKEITDPIADNREDLAKEENKSDTEKETFDRLNIPSMLDFPEPARAYAQQDIQSVKDYINKINELLSKPDDPKLAYKVNEIINPDVPNSEAYKYMYLGSAVYNNRKTKHSDLQRPYIAYYPENDYSFILQHDATLPWYTQELQEKCQKAKSLTRKLAKVAFDNRNEGVIKFWPEIVERLETFSKNPLNETMPKYLESINNEIANMGNADMLAYHGTYSAAFLDMLSDKALLCRKQQEDINGESRFSTQENKRENQEMEQVAFSLRRPNWGYTRHPGSNGDSRFMGNPECIWVVADGGWLIKNQHNRFFYWDGIQFFGDHVEKGFSLPFADSPMCFMMTEKAVANVKQKMKSDPRFTEADFSFLDKKTMIVPDDAVDYKRTHFDLSPDIIEKLKSKIIESSNPYEVSINKGYVVPSGELGDDVSGTKNMTYCWIEKKL